MATADENKALATDTAEALLTNIREAASGVSPSGLRDLAEAFALVRDAMPKAQGRVGTVG